MLAQIRENIPFGPIYERRDYIAPTIAAVLDQVANRLQKLWWAVKIGSAGMNADSH